MMGAFSCWTQIHPILSCMRMYPRSERYMAHPKVALRITMRFSTLFCHSKSLGGGEVATTIVRLTGLADMMRDKSEGEKRRFKKQPAEGGWVLFLSSGERLLLLVEERREVVWISYIDNPSRRGGAKTPKRCDTEKERSHVQLQQALPGSEHSIIIKIS